MEGRYKYLLKNLGFMTISNFSSKILSFLLIPLYTSVLTASEYGTYDLYITTCFLLTPLLSVCIAEAVLRFLLDKSRDSDSVVNIAIWFYVRACIVMSCLILLNYLAGIIKVFNEYPVFLFLYFAFSLLFDIMTQYTRGLERMLDVAIAGILNSILLITLNILLLIVFPMGLKGYFIANCTAFVVTSIYLMIRVKIWKHLRIGDLNEKLRNEMVRYSAPLIASQIGWWINNVSDRYIVTWICGIAVNGIYSVAYKIPSILIMFQTIFNQAWTISAVKEFDGENKKFYSEIYSLYNCVMVIACSTLLLGNKLIARMLFANEFYSAWKYAPFLMISVVFGSLSALFEGIFNAAKRSKTLAQTTIAGAIVNLIMNIILVSYIGAIGAAIATLCSYIVVWGFRLKTANKFLKLDIRLERDVFSYCLLIFQATIASAGIAFKLQCFIEIGLFVMIVLSYRFEFYMVKQRFKNKVK